jgi:hypothetical protein
MQVEAILDVHLDVGKPAAGKDLQKEVSPIIGAKRVKRRR